MSTNMNIFLAFVAGLVLADILRFGQRLLAKHRWNRRWARAKARLEKCAHARVGFVAIPQIGGDTIAPLEIRKCLDCWALEFKEGWTPNIIPPWKERTLRT